VRGDDLLDSCDDVITDIYPSQQGLVPQLSLHHLAAAAALPVIYLSITHPAS
jgi:hypothetical protein